MIPQRVADLDLTSLVRLLWKRRWLVIGSALLFILIFGTIAFTTPRIYSGTTIFVPAHRPGAVEGPMSGLGGLAAALDVGGLSGGVKAQEALALLRSRQFLGEFIAEQKLEPALFEKRWDRTRRAWKPGEQPTVGESVDRFLDRTQYARDKRTLLYFVKVEWPDPAMAARLANGLVGKLNAEMRRRAIAQSSASLEDLRRELEATQEVGARVAIARLMASEINERMFAEVTGEYAFRVVDRAVAADVRDNDRPNKPLLLVLGGMVGGFVGVVAVFLHVGLQHSRARNAGFEQTTRPRI